MKNICEAFYQNITSLYCLPYNTSNASREYNAESIYLTTDDFLYSPYLSS